MSVIETFTVTTIWLAEMLILLIKIHFSFLAVFQDPAQFVHTI